MWTKQGLLDGCWGAKMLEAPGFLSGMKSLRVGMWD